MRRRSIEKGDEVEVPTGHLYVTCTKTCTDHEALALPHQHNVQGQIDHTSRNMVHTPARFRRVVRPFKLAGLCAVAVSQLTFVRCSPRRLVAVPHVRALRTPCLCPSLWFCRFDFNEDRRERL